MLNDLREGKLTMPLLLALPQRVAQPSGEQVAAVLRGAGLPERREPPTILAIVERYDGIAETRALARDYAGAARVALGALPGLARRRTACCSRPSRSSTACR